MRFEPALPDASTSRAEEVARAQVLAAQIAKVTAASRAGNGEHRHPRLLEQLQFRPNAVQGAVEAAADTFSVCSEHFDAVLAGIEAGRV